MNRKLTSFTTKKTPYGLYTFLIALATAAVIFVPFMIYDGGYFLFYGDFNVQQIPFYQHCHEMIKNGNIGWDFTTDLGTNFISSYSFYLLGSPFFWFALLFPNWFVPYLLGPLYIIKFALAALTCYLFIRRFTARGEAATLGGLLYAFSGFSVYNVFYNHFHEAIIFFPLLLLSIELFMTERKRGLVAITVFLCFISNYFFFFGMVVFALIYWITRALSGCYKVTPSKFVLLAVECVIGVLLSAIIILPTAVVIFQNGRTSSFISGWSAVLYGKEQIFLNVIQCFFFPPDLPARAVFFPEAKVQWSSLGGWLPLFSMTGVVCWLKSEKKGHWLRRVLYMSIFMALVPGLNSAFYLFNTAYYARWFYMPILLMCLATAMSLEDCSVDWNSAYRWTMGITVAFSLVIGLLPTIGTEKTTFGLYKDAATNPIKWVYECIRHLFNKDVTVTKFGMYDVRFWLTCLIAVVGLILLRITFSQLKAHRRKFYYTAIPLVCAVSIIYSIFFIGLGKTHSYKDKEVMIDALIEANLDLGDKDTFRVDVCEGVDNTGLYLGLSSINCFHSVVPASVTEFYEFVGIERGVATRPPIESAALRSFLSVKYMLDPQIDSKPQFLKENGKTKLTGYTYHSTQESYAIYENTNFVGYGFSLDYYMTRENATSLGEKHIPEMLLKAVILNDIQIAKYGAYLTNISKDYNVGDYDPLKQSVSFSDEAFINDCAKANSTSAIGFVTTNNGFECTVSRENPNLCIFTIPYEEGWSAYVNGKEATIEKVDVGFMAVFVESGESKIEFVYKTPMLFEGIGISIIGAACFVVYIIIALVVKKVSKREIHLYAEYPEKRLLEASHADYFASEIPDTFEDTGDEFYATIEEERKDPKNIYGGFEGGFNINEDIFDDKEEN